MTARPPIRIALNVALDGILAALAVPLARAIANPAGDALHPLWLLPAGALTLLIAGLPFRLPWQYWRFAGMGELLAVVCASALGAGLFALLADMLGVASANPALPVVHALTLLVLLGAPRVVYRRLRERRGGTAAAGYAPDVPSALIVGATEDIDLFLRALTWDRRQALRVEGLLAVGARQTGRRIQNYPFLGAIDNAAAVLEKLDAEGRLPDTLVVATPDLSGQSLAALVAQAERYGIRIRRAPRPTSLDPASRAPRRPARSAPDGDRGPAQPPAGPARSRRHGAADPGPSRHRHRRRRHHRQRTGAPGGRARPGPPDPARQRRIRAVADRPGACRTPSARAA